MVLQTPPNPPKKFEKLWIIVLCNQLKLMMVCNVEELQAVQMFHCFGAKCIIPH
jgi:hypothetical protein